MTLPAPAVSGPAEATAAPRWRCRFCDTPLQQTVVDLGMSPLCERFPDETQHDAMEAFFPLRPRVCHACWLVQLPAYVGGQEIFPEYAYFSSYSDSWLDHARRYVEGAIERFHLSGASRVVEIGSNDGYLLQYFVRHGIPALGVDPARNVAAAAAARGVATWVAFFGREAATRLVDRGWRADLLIGNNVLAQVPDVNDFVAGVRTLLAPEGVATFEVPHLVRLIEGNQFDTIYHEHFSYFSLHALGRIFAAHDLRVVEVEALPTHGGSLRVHVVPAGSGRRPTPHVAAVLRREQETGVTDPAWYAAFADRVRRLKRALLTYLVAARDEGQAVAAYGAPGKGNTLLNYCGIGPDLVEYTVDRNPYKHGRYCPGTHIPIFPPSRLQDTRPDVILILPWNLRDEIAAQLAYTRAWGARLVVPIPTVAELP